MPESMQEHSWKRVFLLMDSCIECACDSQLLEVLSFNTSLLDLRLLSVKDDWETMNQRFVSIVDLVLMCSGIVEPFFLSACGSKNMRS